MASCKEDEGIEIMISDEPIYCGKCKIKTPTTNFEIKDKPVVRVKKNGELSTNVRKVIQGICEICNTKKHLFSSNNFDRKPKNKDEDEIRDKLIEDDGIVCNGCC